MKKERKREMETTVLSAYSDSNVAFTHLISEKPSDDSFRLHSHNVCEITYIVSGEVSWVIEGRSYMIRKNDLVILRPNLVHGVHIHGVEIYERYNVSFDDKSITDNALEDVPHEIEVLNFSSNTYVTDLFKKLAFYNKSFSGERKRILISHIIEELVFNLTLQTSGKSDESSMHINPVLARALKYMDENYTKCVGVEDMCRELYISKSHIHALFSEHLRISPKKYLNLKRLAHAQRLIRVGKKPYAIYRECGFSDYASFYRNYKIHFGYAPSFELERNMQIYMDIE